VLSYERYLRLAGGRESVAAILDRQAATLGAGLDEDDAMRLANSEVHAVRAARRARGQ
jgi:hypothetical protein